MSKLFPPTSLELLQALHANAAAELARIAASEPSTSTPREHLAWSRELREIEGHTNELFSMIELTQAGQPCFWTAKGHTSPPYQGPPHVPSNLWPSEVGPF